MTRDLLEDSAGPPSFGEARNQRQRARSAGLDPDYWYPVEYDRNVKHTTWSGKKAAPLEVVFWKQSIALFRGSDGVLRAVENRCAHRQIKLTLGQVEGCNLTCAYHGWQWDGTTGKLAHVPHDLFGKPMPQVRIRSYPIKVRYGLIWIFPGDPERAAEVALPEIPELEGPQRWACVPVDFTWPGHHSMIIDNVSDFTHAYLHRKYRPFVDAKLTRCEASEGKVTVGYDTVIGDGPIAKHFVDRKRVDVSEIELCYDYPYQWSNTDGKIRHWCFVLPIDERTSRAFFLFYFESFKVPLLPLHFPRWLMTPILRIANEVLVKPLLREDGGAVAAEQEGYETHFRAPIAEINPAVNLFQQLTIKKWEAYLQRQAASQQRSAGTSDAGLFGAVAGEARVVATGAPQ